MEVARPRAVTYPTLREQVRAVLLAEGFKAREDTIPSYNTGGTFDLVSGAGVEVRVAWWDATGAQQWELLGRMRETLDAAGYEVTPGRIGLYVAEPEKRSDEERQQERRR